MNNKLEIKSSISLIIYLLIINFGFTQDIPYFSGDRAFKFLTEQCDFGPRYPESIGHEKSIEYFTNYFEKIADELIVMNEKVINPITEKEVELTNFYARFNPRNPNRILLMAHWDTRQISDKEELEENRNIPIIGANDGASGVAVLMEIADILHDYPLENIGIDILLTDGEDMGIPSQNGSFGLGTREFSKHIPFPKPNHAICVDMVGDADLEILVEQFSYYQAKVVVQRIWNIANELGYDVFKQTMGQAIFDDHRVLYENTGIPAIDIIDFNYPNTEKNYWHTLQDIPENCSAESLEIVGTVVLTYIYQENSRK
jgi:glutaminyl-peptide cyclotransferase